MLDVCYEEQSLIVTFSQGKATPFNHNYLNLVRVEKLN